MTKPLSMDQAFINRLTEIVKANLADENFGVQEMASEAGMSRSSIHRRLKTIKDQDVSQFIREIRLQCAMELLLHNSGTAAEISYRSDLEVPHTLINAFMNIMDSPLVKFKKESYPSLNKKMELFFGIHMRQNRNRQIKSKNQLAG